MDKSYSNSGKNLFPTFKVLSAKPMIRPKTAIASSREAYVPDTFIVPQKSNLVEKLQDLILQISLQTEMCQSFVFLEQKLQEIFEMETIRVWLILESGNSVFRPTNFEFQELPQSLQSYFDEPLYSFVVKGSRPFCIIDLEFTDIQPSTFIDSFNTFIDKLAAILETISSLPTFPLVQLPSAMSSILQAQNKKDLQKILPLIQEFIGISHLLIFYHNNSPSLNMNKTSTSFEGSSEPFTEFQLSLGEINETQQQEFEELYNCNKEILSEGIPVTSANDFIWPIGNYYIFASERIDGFPITTQNHVSLSLLAPIFEKALNSLQSTTDSSIISKSLSSINKTIENITNSLLTQEKEQSSTETSAESLSFAVCSTAAQSGAIYQLNSKGDELKCRAAIGFSARSVPPISLSEKSPYQAVVFQGKSTMTTDSNSQYTLLLPIHGYGLFQLTKSSPFSKTEQKLASIFSGISSVISLNSKMIHK